MSDTKRVYLLTLVTGTNVAMDCGIRTEIHGTRTEAVARMQYMRRNNDPRECGILPHDQIMVTGMQAVKSLDSDDYVENGKAYRIRIDERAIEPDELEDFENDYGVTIVLTKKYVMTQTVTAKDADQARDMALENAIDGDYDHDISWDYPDDEDVEIDDVNEE